MLNTLPLRWLIVEGLLPLFGAGFLYCLWGCARYLTTPRTQQFQFAWHEAIDSLGWLSGILIIAVQAAIKSWAAVEGEIISFGCIAGAVVCFLVLLSAMNERGQSSTWKPPLSTKIFSFFLVVAILAAASRAQLVSASRQSAAADGVAADSSKAAEQTGGAK